MKSIIISIIILMFSSSMYSQSIIENDRLFLKYEEEYINLTTSDYTTKFEESNRDFLKDFNNKNKVSFEKSKNKEQWLKKNFTKIGFSSANEALDSFAKLNQAKQNLDLANNKLGDLHKELSEKYDVTLIWETLQSRLKK